MSAKAKPITVKINDRTLDQTTVRALELFTRYREWIKDARGFLGSQASETDDRYLFDSVREKASAGITDEVSRQMKSGEAPF